LAHFGAEISTEKLISVDCRNAFEKENEMKSRRGGVDGVN